MIATANAWKNRVAVVTGGASGIGEATAAEFSDVGARVVVLDRISPASNSVEFIGCDVASSGQVKAAANEVQRRFGSVSFLVNAAGIQRYGTAATTSEETWDEVMAVNVKSMFLTFKSFLPMMRTNGASVVNVSSVQAVGALPNSVAYVASKHAIAGLSRALAIDHAIDGIRVNCICPGAVDTPMFRASMKNVEGLSTLLQEIGHLHALNRIARADEIAKAIVFLCSDEASFITGSVQLVDGGMTALVAGKPPAKS